jgi:hypothetical protein
VVVDDVVLVLVDVVLVDVVLVLVDVVLVDVVLVLVDVVGDADPINTIINPLPAAVLE